jgi:subtilisin family serine protease
MIAAGATNTGPRGTITGVAPKAWLGSYKVFPDSDTGAPTSLILRALDDAVADGMDVINLSLGSVLAGRPAEDILVRAVERASDAGAIVVVAAGNTGPDPATISSPATSRSAIAVGNSMNDRVFAASAQAQGGPAFLAVPGSGRNSRLPISAALADVAVLDQTGLACQSLPAGSLQGRIALILRGECFFEEKLNFAEGAGAVAALIYTDASRPDLITMSVGNATLPAMMISNADGVRLKELLPSGAMVVSLQFTSGPVAVDANRLEGSSSRGPSADDNLKPDIVAVGTAIYTASPTSGADTSGYTVATGTSLSAPLVSGAAALLKAARPGLTAQQYRSLLINTSRTLDPAGPLPVRHTGAGVLDPVAALRATVTAFPSSIGFGSGASTVDLTRSLQLSNISKISDTFSITAIPIGAGPVPTIETPAVQISPGESINVSARFTAADLSPGEYQGFLEIAGTQNEVRTRIPYWYAVPSGIPRYITLLAEGTISGRSGAEQTFYFRISDASGLPVRVDPVVEATSGGGTVVGAGQDFRIPGAWAATVRLGSEIGRQTFMIRVGDLTREVAVQVTATTQLP